MHDAASLFFGLVFRFFLPICGLLLIGKTIPYTFYVTSGTVCGLKNRDFWGQQQKDGSKTVPHTFAFKPPKV